MDWTCQKNNPNCGCCKCRKTYGTVAAFEREEARKEMSDEKIEEILLLVDTPARASKSARKKARKARRDTLAECGDVQEDIANIINFESGSTIGEGVILEERILVIDQNRSHDGHIGLDNSFTMPNGVVELALDEPLNDTLANEGDDDDTTDTAVVTVAEAVSVPEKWQKTNSKNKKKSRRQQRLSISRRVHHATVTAAATVGNNVPENNVHNNRVPDNWEELVTEESEGEGRDEETVNATPADEANVTLAIEANDEVTTDESAVTLDAVVTVEEAVTNPEKWQKKKSKKKKRSNRQLRLSIVDLYGDRVHHASTTAATTVKDNSPDNVPDISVALVMEESEGEGPEEIVNLTPEICQNEMPASEVMTGKTKVEDAQESEDKICPIKSKLRKDLAGRCSLKAMKKLETENNIDGLNKRIGKKENLVKRTALKLSDVNEEVEFLKRKLDLLIMTQVKLSASMDTHNDSIKSMKDEISEFRNKSVEEDKALEEDIAHLTDNLKSLDNPAVELERQAANTSSSDPLLEFLQEQIQAKSEELECPVCLEECPQDSPIYQCPSQHLVCGECRPRVRQCPSCRVPYPAWQLPVRHRYAERGVLELAGLRARREGLLASREGGEL